MTIANLNDFSYYTANPMEDYLAKSFAGSMIRYSPNGGAVVYGLTSMAGEGTAKSVVHQYMTKTMQFSHLQVDGAIANGTITTLVVDSTAQAVAGMVYQVWDTSTNDPSGEQVLVSAVTNSTTMTIVRGIGTTAAAAIPDNAILLAVGNAFEQGSDRPASRMLDPTPVQNYTQIFRNSWALPHTMTAMRPIVGDSLVAEGKRDAGMFHAIDIEKAILFGQKKTTTYAGQQLTKMDGIINSVKTLAPSANTTIAGATTTYDQLEAALEPCFETQVNGITNSQRLLVVGSGALRVINKIGRLYGEYQLVEGQTSFGLQFKTFMTSRGTFRLVEHPLFNSNAMLSKMAVAIDLNAIKIMHLEGRKTRHDEFGMDGKSVQDGQDAVGGTLTSELTMENINPSAHVVIANLTAAA